MKNATTGDRMAGYITLATVPVIVVLLVGPGLWRAVFG